MLEAFEQEKEVVVNTREVSHVVRETREDTGSQFCNVFTSILKSGSDFVTVAKRLEYNLLSESEFADNKQRLDNAEGDAYQSIKEAWVTTISGTMLEAISRAIFEAILKVKIGIGLRRVEENVQ